MLMVQEVRGMAAHDICSAVIDRPAPAVDECLARIGRGGRIALKAQATASPETIARVHSHRVDMINGRSLAAIAAEDGPARPLAAAELHRRANGGLERYVRTAASGRIDGHLKDVHRGGAPGEAYANINHVDGLDSRQFCIAVVPQVDKQTEELLEKIGRGGRIRLTGSCTAEAGGLAAGRMDRVGSTSDSAHELTPQRSPAQMCTPSMSTLTALTDPQERPSGSVPQSRMVSYGFGPSLIGSTAACSGGPEAPRWAAAAAGSRKQHGAGERGVLQEADEQLGLGHPFQRGFSLSHRAQRRVPAVSMATRNTVLPDVTYRVFMSAPPKARLVMVSCGIGIRLTSSPAGENT